MAVKKYSQYGFARKNTLHRDFSSVPEEAFLDAVYRWREYRECLAVEWEAAEEARDVFRAEFMFFNAPELGYKPDRKVGYVLSGPVKKTVWP